MNITSIFTTGFWERYAWRVGDRIWNVVQVLVFFLLVRFIAYKLIDRIMKAVAGNQSASSQIAANRVRTLGSLIKSVIFYVLVFISGVMILKEFKLDAAPVLTAAGVVGLAVGFGAQKLVRDVLSGFFIVLEDQYSVGDYITVGTVTGSVQELGMRITKLRDDMGKLIIIPNGEIAQVINHSRGPLVAELDISVHPKSDPERVYKAINAAGSEIAEKVDGVVTHPTARGIVALDAAKMTIRVNCEVKTGRQYAVQTALREAIRGKLVEAGIELA